MALEELSAARREIDAIDKDILRSLSMRLTVAGRIAEIKQDNNLPLVQKERELELLKDRTHHAELLGLPADMAQQLMVLLMDFSKRVQRTKLEKPAVVVVR